MPTAIITGASRGLGLALARALAQRGWNLVLDARGAEALERAAGELAAATEVRAIPGDVTDEAHRRDLVKAAEDRLAPTWSPATAAELFWAVTSLRAWEDLVLLRGWTSDEWVEATVAALEAAFVASGEKPRSAGNKHSFPLV